MTILSLHTLASKRVCNLNFSIRARARADVCVAARICWSVCSAMPDGLANISMCVRARVFVLALSVCV